MKRPSLTAKCALAVQAQHTFQRARLAAVGWYLLWDLSAAVTLLF